MKPQLFILVDKLAYFFSWEARFFQDHFDVVSYPHPEAYLYAAGNDVFWKATGLPCKKRISFLTPGFSLDPYHNKMWREAIRQTITDYYDLVFTSNNVLSSSIEHPRIKVRPLSLPWDKLPPPRVRTKAQSFLHASANWPHKCLQNQIAILSLLEKYSLIERGEVYPDASTPTNVEGYGPTDQLYLRMRENDVFIHIAPDHPFAIDNSPPATVLEAAATGAICFWYDQYAVGCPYETILTVSSAEPVVAVADIYETLRTLDVAAHSLKTAEELRRACDPVKTVKFLADAILALS